MNLGRFLTARNRAGPVRPVTAVTGPVPSGLVNPDSEVTKMAVAADVYTLLQGLEAGAAYLCRPQERKENASSCSREVKDCERY